jgi:hypothetical protein
MQAMMISLFNDIGSLCLLTHPTQGCLSIFLYNLWVSNFSSYKTLSLNMCINIPLEKAFEVH